MRQKTTLFALAFTLLSANVWAETVDPLVQFTSLANNTTQGGFNLVYGTNATASDGNVAFAFSNQRVSGLEVQLDDTAKTALGDTATIVVDYRSYTKPDANHTIFAAQWGKTDYEHLVWANSSAKVSQAYVQNNNADGDRTGTWSTDTIPASGKLVVSMCGTTDKKSWKVAFLNADGVGKVYQSAISGNYVSTGNFNVFKIGGSFANNGSYHRPAMTITGVTIYKEGLDTVFPEVALKPQSSIGFNGNAYDSSTILPDGSSARTTSFVAEMPGSSPTYEAVRDSDTDKAIKITGTTGTNSDIRPGYNSAESMYGAVVGSASWTVQLVAKAKAISTKKIALWGRGGASWNNYKGVALLADADGKIVFVSYASKATTTLVSCSDMTSIYDDRFHAITVVCDMNAAAKYKVYVDGVLAGSSEATVALATMDTGLFQLGTIYGGAKELDSGAVQIANETLIDDVAAWAYPLNASEVSALAAKFPVWPKNANVVAEIDEQEYSSLAQAIEAAQIATAETPVAITLVKACSETVAIPQYVTVKTSSSAQFTGTVTGAGRIVFEGYVPSDATAASFQNGTTWTGTVEIKSYSPAKGTNYGIVRFPKFANANSTIAINAVTSTSYLKSGDGNGPLVAKAIEIMSGGLTLDHGAFSTTDMLTGNLIGSGTIHVTGYAGAGKNGQVCFKGNHSGFKGSVNVGTHAQNKRVVFLGASESFPADSTEYGTIYVSSGCSLNLSSAATWTAPNGIKIAGTVDGAGTYNAAVTLTAADASLKATTVTSVSSGVEGKGVFKSTSDGVSTYTLGEAVATVNDEPYETLDAAFAAASGEDVVTLVKAITGDLTIPDNKKVNAGSIGISGAIEIGAGAELTISGNRTTQGISGSGTLIIESGAITAKNKSSTDYAVNGVTVRIDGGTLTLNLGNGDPQAKDATFVIGANGGLTNYGYLNLSGLITIDTESDKTVFVGSCFRGAPNIVKSGSGNVTFNLSKAGSSDKFTSLALNGGSLKVKSETTVDALTTTATGYHATYDPIALVYSLVQDTPQIWDPGHIIFDGDLHTYKPNADGTYTRVVDGVTYTINLKGHQLVTENGESYILIKEHASGLGMTVTRSTASSATGETVIMRYADYPAYDSTTPIRVPMTLQCDKGGAYLNIAEIFVADANGTVKAGWADFYNGLQSGSGSPSKFVQKDGSLALSYGKNGTNGGVYAFQKTANDWNMLFTSNLSGSGTDNMLGAALGGLYQAHGTGDKVHSGDGATTTVGMKVYGVAVTYSPITTASADNLTNFTWPSEVADETTKEVANQTTEDTVYVGKNDVYTITGQGGLRVTSMTLKAGSKLVLDPARTPVLATNFAIDGAAKIKVVSNWAGHADEYEQITCGKFHLITYPNTLTIDPSRVSIEGLKNGVTYEVKVVDVADTNYKQLVLDVGNYETNGVELKITQFGDSITEGIWRSSYVGTPNYRIPLMHRLEAHGYKPITTGFRGDTLKNNNSVWGSSDANGVFADPNYRLHNGISAQRVYTGSTSGNIRAGFMEGIEAYLEASGDEQDIITIKIGTNDIIGGESADNVYEGWEKLIRRLIALRPQTRIVVTSILDLKDSGQSSRGATYSEKIRQAVEVNKIFGENKVFYVDCRSASPQNATPENFLASYPGGTDYVHPCWTGYNKMADAWLGGVLLAAEASTGSTYTPNTKSGAEQNVDEKYRHGFVKLATMDLAKIKTDLSSWGGASPLTIVNAAAATKNLRKIAYYVERSTTKSRHNQYVWVDMDAWAQTPTLANMGVPTSMQVNQLVNNLHICSNLDEIRAVEPTEQNVQGTLLFTNKGCGPNKGIADGPDSKFGMDWNDTLGDASYGAMVVSRIYAGATATTHRYALGQTLFCYNGFNNGIKNILGIGDFAVHCMQSVGNSGMGTMTLNWISPSDNLTYMSTDYLDNGIIEIWGQTDETPRVVATVRSWDFTSLEDAIAFVKPYAENFDGGLDALLAQIELVTPLTAQVPDGYELVKDSSDVYHLKSLGQVADYIVISPRNYVTDWTTYVTARAKSPVAAGITFAVKAADEIYAAYPANAENTNGDPRNDAESIHKYIGMMQAKGAKYFVLGGRWVDVQAGSYDRTTLIPGIAVYPKAKKPAGFNLDTIASDLYYACHYKADGQNYVWDPNGDKIYVGLCEDSPDQMEDVRHFQPNCVVSRMNFFADTYGGSAKTYSDLIAAYTTKLQRGEGNTFAGADRYMVWATRCEKDVGDKPDCYPAQKARADYIPTVRAANEIYFSYLLNSQTVEQVNELRSTVLGQDWEILIPVEHGSAEGLGNLQCDHIKASNQIIKFFMGNVPCLTGQVSANGCFSDVALSNPNGGTLVSINNTSYGYASTSGMAGRKFGVSDEIVDWCLDHYLDGSTAGEAWRYAIDQYTSIMLDENGFKDGVLEARGHDGVEADGTPEKVYVFAAFLEQMLFGDPLVKIQTEPGASSLVATVSHPAKLTYHSLPDALSVAATDSAANTIGLFRTTTVDESLAIAAEDVLEIESGKGLIAKGGLTVNGTLSGAGTISGAVTFGADATLEASGTGKLSLAAGSSLTVAESGINLILPSGTTAIPAATTMVVMNQSDLTGTWEVASAKAAGSDAALEGTIELIAANDAIFVIDSSNLVKLDSIQTGKGAVIESVVIVNGEDETPAVMESKKYFLIPSGATIKVTCRPDLDHSGAVQTITVENVTAVGTVTDAMTGYAYGRAPATVFVDGDSNVTYTGDMLNKVLLPEGEADTGTYVEHRTSIVAGDTVVFDVAHHLEGKTVVVMSKAAGAELHIDANLTMIPGEAAAILGGKRVDVQDGKTLTLKPTADYDLTLGADMSFNGGTVMMTTDSATKFIKTDALAGASLIDIRSPLVIKPATAAGTIAWSGRLAGNGTIEGAVAVHAGAHLIVRGAEFLTVPNLTSHEHRLTIDAMASTPEKGEHGKCQPLTVLKVADQATAEALIPNMTLVEPELTHADGKRVLFQLAATDDGSIVMKELEFVITEGFFKNGMLGHNEEVVWKHDSGFASGDYGISVTCPAEIAFDFTGADSKATITVAKPITLSGSGALTFDVPTGRTVYVNCTISGNAGVTKTGGGTLIFGLPEGMTEEGGLEGENARAGWNTFYGALTVEEGTVRSTKGHGYGARHVVDGETDVPEIEIHSGATLDLAHICDQEMLEIITAGTITNSFHHASGATVGQIKQLTLKGDATVTGHTFGMAHDSIINLQGHVLTISMERGECVTETIAPGKTEVRDHEFELDNTKVLGGRDNLATPDIIVRQGTLSCEGSTYANGVFTMGDNDLLDAALYVGAEGCLRLDANLTVKRIQMVNGNKDVVVPCDENPDGTGTPAAAHTHTFKKVWEESLKQDADPTSDADNKYFGHIIIRQELKGGISAPRLTLGRMGDPTKSLHDADDDMNSPEIRRIVLDKGEYIDCQQEFVMTAGKIGSQFNVFFLDWTGESGARRIFHGWEKFSHDLSLSEILNPYGVKPKADGGYRLMLGDWYPYGAYAFADDPVSAYNTLPLEDQNWAYAISLWPYVEDGEERPYDFVNTLITTITHLDGEPLYNPELNDGVHNLYDDVLVTTNGLLKCYCQRGDGKMDFVIGEAWIKQYMGADKYHEYMDKARYLGGNGTISKWLNAKGANGIERWQSYMLGLDPTNAHSLPVLAVRKDVAPSEKVNGKDVVNVHIAGLNVYGYQYISPVYAIEELDPATMEPKVVNPGARNEAETKHTPWQSSINFQVEVPTKVDAQGKSVPAYDHVKYFRVKVSFQGNDGITN